MCKLSLYTHTKTLQFQFWRFVDKISFYLQRYMKPLFDYDPTVDELLPCKEIGLPFFNGDILQIISIKDPNWWQAKHAGTEGFVLIKYHS